MPRDRSGRRATADELLTDWVSGPRAATEATARALVRAESAEALILVEGVSDQIAVETLARRRDRDLDAEGVVVLPVGGAHGVGRYLERFGPAGAGLHLTGLCDRAEQALYLAGLTRAGMGRPSDRADLERMGFHVCVEDLEDELIRAAGLEGMESVLAANGDLGAFRTLQNQPAWRGRPADAQLRRFLGAGARRKLRYARLLVEALELDAVPAPLAALLTDALSGPRRAPEAERRAADPGVP